MVNNIFVKLGARVSIQFNFMKDIMKAISLKKNEITQL